MDYRLSDVTDGDADVEQNDIADDRSLEPEAAPE
jgi:hypothetical protein